MTYNNIIIGPQESINVKTIQRTYIGSQGDYCFEVDYLVVKEVHDWCINSFGDEPDSWFRIDNVFLFEKEDCRNWFILRWGS